MQTSSTLHSLSYHLLSFERWHHDIALCCDIALCGGGLFVRTARCMYCTSQGQLSAESNLLHVYQLWLLPLLFSLVWRYRTPLSQRLAWALVLTMLIVTLL